jgi:hypothetical protein
LDEVKSSVVSRRGRLCGGGKGVTEDIFLSKKNSVSKRLNVRGLMSHSRKEEHGREVRRSFGRQR